MSSLNAAGASNPDINNVNSVTYYIGTDATTLKVNQTQMVGRYLTIADAVEALTGLLYKCGVRDVATRLPLLNTSIVYASNLTSQNVQTANSLGSFYGHVLGPTVPNYGVISTANPNFLELQTVAGATVPRARVINENDAYAGVDPTDYSAAASSMAVYDASVRASSWDAANANTQHMTVGYFTAHNALSPSTPPQLEKFVGFRPTSSSTWQCCVFQKNGTLFVERFAYDTGLSISTRRTLSVIVYKNGQNAHWLADGIPLVGTSATSLSLPNLLYFDAEVTPNSAYVGCEVKQRVVSATAQKLELYSSQFRKTV